MPFINVKTNIRVENKNKLKDELGKIITMIPGKTEAVTMIEIEDNCDLYYAGSAEPCAIVETMVNAATDHSCDKEYANAVMEMIAEETIVPITRIYALINSAEQWYSRRNG